MRRTIMSYEEVKEKALEVLEGSDAKEEALALLKKHKDVFVGEAKGYLRAMISTFTGGEYDPEKYAEFVATLDDQQLVDEVAATASEISGLVASYTAKKDFLSDMKTVASVVVRKAIVAGLSAYVGPAAGPIANFLIPGSD
jgi:hypothetical protein